MTYPQGTETPQDPQSSKVVEWMAGIDQRIENRERQFRTLAYGIYVAAGCIVAVLCTAFAVVFPKVPTNDRLCVTHEHAVTALLHYQNTLLKEKKFQLSGWEVPLQPTPNIDPAQVLKANTAVTTLNNEITDLETTIDILKRKVIPAGC